MEITSLYHWICFMFCLGLTAGGILVLFRRKEYSQYPAFRYLQYYLILIYTFGFYALWSQILLRSLFFAILKPDSMAALARFLILLSVPFLLAGKLMLVLWTVHVVNRPVRGYLLPSLIPLLLLLALLVFSSQGNSWTLYQVYAILVLILMIWVGAQLVFSEVRYLGRNSKTVLVSLLIGVGILHGLLLLNWREIPAADSFFVVLYFLMHTAFVTYYIYQAVLPEPLEVGLSQIRDVFTQVPASFEAFTETYGITPREAEIIQKIYQGKANKEIAEELFVTLQTIKDHTHRIYQKTNVKSRSQLASLLRTFQK